MERHVFQLLTTKTFRHNLKLYISAGENKTYQKNVVFTTEHLVTEKERVSNAKKKAAEYSTSDEAEIDALFRDTGYGKTFILKGDKECKHKKEPFRLTPIDAERVALRNLFEAAGLDFDGRKDVKVLDAEYRKFIQATSGAAVKEGVATIIPHKQVNVEKSIKDQMLAAHSKFEEVYGKPIPEGFENDFVLLDGMNSEGFNALEYIKENGGSEADTEGEGSGELLPGDAESLQKIYFDEYGVNPANAKKNDIVWLQNKIVEQRSRN